MKKTKLIPNYIMYIAILVLTFFSLYISFQITSNNFKDNSRYSQAYFLMNKHHLNIPSKNINNMYYLVDSPKDSKCIDKGHMKYYLLGKSWYKITDSNGVLNDSRYELVSCINSRKIREGSGVIHEKGYYIQKDRTLSELLQTYKTTIGATEPIYILLSYISSSILDYNYFILLLNLVFLLVVFLALKKFTKNYMYMYMLLVSFDFYFYIYLSNTHRLKLAIIFLLLSYLTHNKTKIIMMVSALLSHLQVFIVYLYYLILTLINDAKLDIILSKKKIYSLYMLLIFALGFFFLDQIIAKVSYYLQIEIPYKVAALILMYLIYLFIFKLKDTIKLFVPLAIMVLVISFLIGSDRVNFLLMEFILIVELNRLLNKNTYALYVVIPFILYSIYKSVNYIQLGIQ